jgi:UDP-glucose 4-epimerase
MRDVDLVVHLASVVHRPDASEDEMRRVNVYGTCALTEAAIGAGVPRMIFVSSVAAVGAGVGARIDEDAVPRPRTLYGRSKLEAEDAVLRLAARSGMNVTVLRPPMVYGPGMKGNPLRLFWALTRHVPLPFRGARSQRSALFVGNLVAGIHHLARTAPNRSMVFNIADEECTSIEEFVRASARALGVRAILLPSPHRLLRTVAAAAERLTPGPYAGRLATLADSVGGPLAMSTSRLQRCTGFLPPFTRESGLAETARWFRAVRP